MKRWEIIAEKLTWLEARETELRCEWQTLMASCSHPNLPRRELGEEYSDVCPDCGHVSYCHKL